MTTTCPTCDGLALSDDCPDCGGTGNTDADDGGTD